MALDPSVPLAVYQIIETCEIYTWLSIRVFCLRFTRSLKRVNSLFPEALSRHKIKGCMNRDGGALTPMRAPLSFADRPHRSNPGQGTSRAARKRRSVAARKSAILPLAAGQTVEPKIADSAVAPRDPRSQAARRSLAHGKVKLLEHRVAALEKLLRTKQEQLDRLHEQYGVNTLDDAARPLTGRPVRLRFPSHEQQLLAMSSEFYPTVPDGIRQALLSSRGRSPSPVSDDDKPPSGASGPRMAPA